MLFGQSIVGTRTGLDRRDFKNGKVGVAIDLQLLHEPGDHITGNLATRQERIALGPVEPVKIERRVDFVWRRSVGVDQLLPAHLAALHREEQVQPTVGRDDEFGIDRE